MNPFALASRPIRPALEAWSVAVAGLSAIGVVSMAIWIIAQFLARP